MTFWFDQAANQHTSSNHMIFNLKLVSAFASPCIALKEGFRLLKKLICVPQNVQIRNIMATLRYPQTATNLPSSIHKLTPGRCEDWLSDGELPTSLFVDSLIACHTRTKMIHLNNATWFVCDSSRNTVFAGWCRLQNVYCVNVQLLDCSWRPINGSKCNLSTI